MYSWLSIRSSTLVSFCFLLFISFTQLSGQTLARDKFYAGGGIGSEGIVFSTFNIRVSANGQLGYKITDQLSTGVNLRYIYDQYRLQNITLNHIGAGVFTRYIITRNIFTQAEYERMTYQVAIANDLSNTTRIGFNSLFVGGGYYQPLSRNASFVLTGFYNLLYGDGSNSQYNSPFLIRAGFNVGF